MRIPSVLAAAALGVGLAGCGGAEPVRADLLMTADRVFDGREVIERGAVAIRGAEVVAVGPANELDVDAKRTRRLGDATILPGLIDLHVHRLGEGQQGSAMTTVRDLGAPEGLLPVRQRTRAPRVLAAGPLITVPDGYPIPIHGPAVAGVVRGPEDARAFVRRLAVKRARVIKISLEFGPGDWPVLSAEEIRAIVDAAHDLDLLVTAHVGDPRAARLALETGVDELAHMPCGGPDPQLMRRLAERGVPIVGTLHVRDGCGLANAQAFVQAGGTLLYGSDYANPRIPAGVDVAELRLMKEAGLTALQVLENATARAAEQLPVDGLGLLEPGSSADVVVVRGDPMLDLATLRTPLLLLVRGEIVIDGARLVLP